jgi:hypothetical protein
MGEEMNSIIQDERECFFTGRTDALERHHIFGGANRKLSEKYGLTVWLTHDIHNEPPYGVHHNKGLRLHLQQIGQRAFEKRYPELDFMTIFGRNYL